MTVLRLKGVAVDFSRPGTVPREGLLALVKGPSGSGWQLCTAGRRGSALCWTSRQDSGPVEDKDVYAPADAASLEGAWTEIDADDSSTWPDLFVECLVRPCGGPPFLASLDSWEWSDKDEDGEACESFLWSKSLVWLPSDRRFGSVELCSLKDGDRWIRFEVEE
jgi:hypothetical protein